MHNLYSDKYFRNLIKNPSEFPISFRYGGRNYAGFGGNDIKEISRSVSKKDSVIKEDISFCLCDKLTLTLKTVRYTDFDGADFVLYISNDTDSESEIISDIVYKDSLKGDAPRLRGILGDHDNNYEPYDNDLTVCPVHFYNNSGRPTHVSFPYFDLCCGNGGCLMAIGWAGSWEASFTENDGKAEFSLASTPELHTVILPGETIRTALFALIPYKGREMYIATNVWRRWFIKYNLPKMDNNGTDLHPFSTLCMASDTGLPNSDGSISENHTTWKRTMDLMRDVGVKVDFRWFDAGWYEAPDGSTVPVDWWSTVGTWKLDKEKWPGDSFRQSTDYARSMGMKTLMWFEPERVSDVDSMVKRHGYKKEWAIEIEGRRDITNFIGDPDCLKWTTGRICDTLRENKVEMYREDNNSNPGSLWRYLDSKSGDNRKGSTECHVVMSHYKMWDDIINCTLSYGGCGFVDSCASGGGRNDLESLRRGVPLLRSDADRTTTALRLSMTSAFNRWVPFCGASTKESVKQLEDGAVDKYVLRASILPVYNAHALFFTAPDGYAEKYPGIIRGLDEWKRVSAYQLKDFYLLTPWHNAHDKSSFTAFAFFDNDENKGVLELFCMEGCPCRELNVKLPFADEGISYTLKDEDTGLCENVSGKTLKNGYSFSFTSSREARIVWINP